MPSKINKKIKSIQKVLGPYSNPHTYNFIESNKSYLKNHTLSSQLNTIGNYVYLLCDGNYSCLKNIEARILYDEYSNYVNNFKLTFKNSEYIEHNKIILDNRINGIGFYWVDLEKEFCLESMIRMEDCGRVNYGNTTLELRDHLNESHMIVVYEKNTGNIRQIKGKGNSKPENKYWNNLYELLIGSDYYFNEYIPTYKPENDLLITDLPLSSQLNIYSKHPNLKKDKTII